MAAVHNTRVPFTPAHGAAILPFLRFGLVPSALLVGAFAPDYEYFIRLGPNGRYGHTFPGVFLLTLPLALVVLWLFHSFVKAPAVRLLPEGIQRRLGDEIREFRFGGAGTFALIVCSLLLGIATHLHSLRHYSATELLTAGVDLRTVAGRLGHGGGGATTLKVYAAWVAASDRKAAELLRTRLPARRPKTE